MWWRRPSWTGFRRSVGQTCLLGCHVDEVKPVKCKSKEGTFWDFSNKIVKCKLKNLSFLASDVQRGTVVLRPVRRVDIKVDNLPEWLCLLKAGWPKNRFASWAAEAVTSGQKPCCSWIKPRWPEHLGRISTAQLFHISTRVQTFRPSEGAHKTKILYWVGQLWKIFRWHTFRPGGVMCYIWHSWLYFVSCIKSKNTLLSARTLMNHAVLKQELLSQ